VKYLFSFIFLLNVIFYSCLIFIPLNNSYILTISQGDNLNKIFQNLEDVDISFPRFTKILINLFEIDRKLSLGSYEITPDDSLFEVFKKLYDGQIILKKFIIQDGSRVKDLFPPEVVNSFCESKNIPLPCNLEGLIMPDVYLYDRKEELIRVLNNAVESQKKNIDLAWKQRDDLLDDYSKYQLLIIASILEKESCLNERKRISGVIFNRLNKNMLLQMDSTTIYGLKSFNGDLKKSHLKDSSLYNTYMHKGLPPGPISNPSFGSLVAAGQPEIHKYLFFVANGKCSHKFSTNYEDHSRAVEEFQLNR
tara:strand:- start:685 stop:1605 length:921 start_codon:yes stop_codon:yes gene_type:complete